MNKVVVFQPAFSFEFYLTHAKLLPGLAADRNALVQKRVQVTSIRTSRTLHEKPVKSLGQSLRKQTCMDIG